LVSQYIAFVANQGNDNDDAAKNFWISLYRDFFKKWPIGDPSAETLDAFSGNVAKAKAAMKSDKEQVSVGAESSQDYITHQNSRRSTRGTTTTSAARVLERFALRLVAPRGFLPQLRGCCPRRGCT
jgi:hypothetical protein